MPNEHMTSILVHSGFDGFDDLLHSVIMSLDVLILKQITYFSRLRVRNEMKMNLPIVVT
ncbi:hypothetical protein D3C73_1577290 [compost metagenome]